MIGIYTQHRRLNACFVMIETCDTNIRIYKGLFQSQLAYNYPATYACKLANWTAKRERLIVWYAEILTNLCKSIAPVTPIKPLTELYYRSHKGYSHEHSN